MPWRHSLSACLHKLTRQHIISCKYCRTFSSRDCSVEGGLALLTGSDSAELEMTVNILIQIDKLVQLIESPVFTCESDAPI